MTQFSIPRPQSEFRNNESYGRYAYGSGQPMQLPQAVGDSMIPGPSRVTVAPRSRPQAQIPSALPQSPSLNPYQLQNQNNGAATNAQSAEKQYVESQFQKYYDQKQREMAPTPIPSSPSSIYPPAPGQPGPSTQIPSQYGALRMTNAAGQSFNGNPIPSAPQSGPASPMIPPQSASQLPAYSQLTPNEKNFTQNTSATGTLRGSFQAHDAAGNAIPGQFNNVDASAPRDLANLQANARANARISPEFNQALHSDPGFQQAQQGVADVKAATAAKMPLSLYQQHQQALANPQQAQEQQDLAALSPKDRLNYQRQQALDKQKGEQGQATLAQKDAQGKQQQANEDRKFKLAQDKQTIDAFGGAAKFVIGAAKQMGDWWTKTGQQAAQNAKTNEQKIEADRKFHLEFEKHVGETWKQMTAKNSKLTSADYDKMRKDMEARIYGYPKADDTPTQTATGGTNLPPNGTPINLSPNQSSGQNAAQSGDTIDMGGGMSIVRNADKTTGTWKNPDGTSIPVEWDEKDKTWYKSHTPSPQSGASATTQPPATGSRAGSASPQSATPSVNEGTESTSKSGKPIVFTGGKWVYKS